MTTQNPFAMGLDVMRQMGASQAQIEGTEGERQRQRLTEDQAGRVAETYDQAQLETEGRQLFDTLAKVRQLPADQRMIALQNSPFIDAEDFAQVMTPELLSDAGLDQVLAANPYAMAKDPNEVAAQPSSVREWEYYNSLDEDQKRSYLAMKRAQQTFKAGDVTLGIDQVGGGADVITETGTEPTTQADAQAVLTEQAAVKSATEAAADQAIALSGEAFGQLETVRSAIPNLEEAIQLVDEGANTGVIMSKLPSVQEASIKLDNLQGRLGLDVIGNTTFGALSESELKFALDTALPKNLSGEALKDWLQKKKDSQTKLAGYLEDAAIFLGKPGNTIADFLEMKKSSVDLTTLSDDDLMNFD